MDPVCFYLFNRPIYWYGVMFAAAFLASLAHLAVLGKKEGRPAAFGSDLAFWVMVGALAGARIAYVGANFREFAAEPLAILRVDQGGLIYYGGFLGAALAGILFARIRREPILNLGDFLITALPLGHAIGRMGCFLNGCCYGSAWTGLWSVTVAGLPRHPTPLYESLGNLIIYGVLRWVYLRRRKQGQVLALYLMLYPLLRFILEFFRGDERLRWCGLALAQDLSLVLFFIGILLWFTLLKRGRPPPDIRHDCASPASHR